MGLVGIIYGGSVFYSSTESRPLSFLLGSSQVYLIALSIVFGYHLIFWLLVDKGMLSFLGTVLQDMVSSSILFLVLMFCSISLLFLFKYILF